MAVVLAVLCGLPRATASLRCVVPRGAPPTTASAVDAWHVAMGAAMVADAPRRRWPRSARSRPRLFGLGGRCGARWALLARHRGGAHLRLGAAPAR